MPVAYTCRAAALCTERSVVKAPVVTSRRVPPLVDVESPWLDTPGQIRVLEHAPDAGGAAPPTDRPFILEQHDRRLMFFTLDFVQSTMRLDAPDALVARYLKKMMAFLLVLPQPKHILMIGLGGGSLTKFCFRNLPTARITVLEISADVIAMRDEFMIPADDERLRIVHAEGAEYVRNARDSYDVILVDAFDADGISPWLSEAAFFDDARRRLTSTGILVMNLNGEPTRYGPALHGISSAFAGATLALQVHGRHNLVLYGVKGADPDELLRGAAARAAELDARLDIGLAGYLPRLRKLPAYIGRPLHDQGG